MGLKNKVLSVCALAFLVGCANIPGMNTTSHTCPHASCKAHTKSVVGVYKAMLPCADCSGIDATLNLKADNTFEIINITSKYSEKDSGKYSVNGDIITTENQYKEKQMYKIDGYSLKMLDADGKEPVGKLAKFYTFNKIK